MFVLYSTATSLHQSLPLPNDSELSWSPQGKHQCFLYIDVSYVHDSTILVDTCTTTVHSILVYEIWTFAYIYIHEYVWSMINTYLKDFYSRYVPLKCETHLPPKVKVLQRNAVVRDVASWISWWNHLFVFMRFRLKNEAFLSIVVEHRTLPETKSSHLKIGHPKRKLIFQASIFRCYISFREGNNQFPSVLKLNLWFTCNSRLECCFTFLHLSYIYQTKHHWTCLDMLQVNHSLLMGR